MSEEINKLVPKLRFPEFSDSEDWEEAKLLEITDRLEKKVGDLLLTTVSISAGIGFVSQAEKFSRDISGLQYKNYIVLEKGDFAYNKGNSKKFPQGCIYELKEFEKVAAPNAFICFRFKNHVVANFYLGYFENNFHGKQLQKFITSGARMDGLLNISSSNFFSIILPTPKAKPEQQKIADCLSSLDDLISTQNQKLETLKAYKKGMMQQLFPAEGETVPQLRFPEFRDSGNWEENILTAEGVASFINEKTTNNYLNLETYVSTENILPNYAGIALSSKLPAYGSFTKFQRNDILISNIRPYLKKVWFADMNGAASNDVIVIRANYKIKPLFLSFILKNDEFINFIMKSAEGVKMPRGDKDVIKEYSLTFPSLQEQQKIAGCLSSLDEQISVQKEKIAALKQHKKGLMQGLFPNITASN